MLSSTYRRGLLVVSATIVAGLLLAGCSQAEAGTTESSTEPTASGTHSVEHARGTTVVPDDPQRIVVLEPVQLDTAVALGKTPVGAAVASNVAGVPAYLGVDGVEAVGTVPEPDLEAIAALKPDLILGTEARHSKLYAQLEAIAPTVFMATQADPWQENVELIGEALGEVDETKKLLAGYNDRCAEIADEFTVDGKTANLLRPRDETTMSLYGPVSFAGSAIECVGLTIPDQDWQDGLQADISPENITDAKADYLFVVTSDVNDTSTIPAAITQNLGEFPSVTLVDTSYWVSGVGPKGGALVLDDLEKFLEAQQ
ncbi:ABC transporter substrate-binding protein [Microbacterium nymphoidis]|uniref:ABC transporter substrate-binding protein n=1 Tax=Microbacterium nymphoidis TaxID=2898586 RepID=UPI001E402F7A|nr:iron-siderophore ABC transporter substrate-binding protein [Microbacterium nymphoidis]MCD2498480.1 iron-siderophore ABC transporter substrate-binding protein [Microbacterium nymphoidis]